MCPRLGVRSPLERCRRFRVGSRLLNHDMRNHGPLNSVEVTPAEKNLA
jgi:hypothetical protein